MGEIVNHRRNSFIYEKDRITVSLPASINLWPTLHGQLTAYKEAVGGTLPNALRWAARYGANTLLQNATGMVQENAGVPIGMSVKARNVFEAYCEAKGKTVEQARADWFEMAAHIFASLGFDFNPYPQEREERRLA